jgi:GNAT superfamily N-acetyltransferase
MSTEYGNMMGMRVADVTVESGEATELNTFLEGRIRAFNVSATGIADAMPLHARIVDANGLVIAAMSGHTWGGCCDIVLLWVHEAHRGRGLGTALVYAAEAEAARRGCSQVTLATHTFQAPAFDEKMGYTQVGAILDYPRGHAKIHYVKRLSGPREV